MDTNNDGIIDDPLATRKVGRPLKYKTDKGREKQKALYNERHKAWSKRMTREKRKNAILSLLSDFGVSPNNVDEVALECVMDDTSLVIYYKKAS